MNHRLLRAFVLLSLLLGAALDGCREVDASDTLYKLQRVWDPYKRCYVSQYVEAHVDAVVPNSYHYEYNIQYSQPAAAQGTTVYGHRPVLDLSVRTYQDIDQGALLDYATRSRDAADRHAGRVLDLKASAQAATAHENAGVIGVAKLERLEAFVEKLGLILDKADKNTLDVTVGEEVRSDIFVEEVHKAARPNDASYTPLAPGPKTKQHCAACHGKDSTNQEASDAFKLNGGSRSAAFAAVLNGSMPKGHKLSEAEQLDLLREINSQP